MSSSNSYKKRLIPINLEEGAVELLNYVVVKVKEKPQIPFFLPLILIAWAVDTWLFSFSNWLPLALALWASIQVSNFIVLDI